MSGWLVEGRETLKPKAKAKQNKSDDVDGKKGGKERVIWVLIHSIPKQKPSCHMMTNDLWGACIWVLILLADWPIGLERLTKPDQPIG
jgi:hypothetical protein